MSDVVMLAPASFRLSRTALWVHGLGLVFLGVSVAAALLSGTADGTAMLGVGSAAWIALSTWSMLLAVRSRRQEGSSVWWTVLWMTVLFEVSSIFVLPWIFDYQSWHLWRDYRLLRSVVDDGFETCLPILFPFLFLSLCIALPLSTWTMKRFFSRRRWLCIVGIIGLLGVLILPWVILPYSLSTKQLRGTDLFDDNEFKRAADFRWKLAKLTPRFIADTEENLLQKPSLPRLAIKVGLDMLEGGFVSKDRLLTRIYDSDRQVVFLASRAYQTNYHNEALAHADEVISNTSNSISAGTRVELFGWFVGNDASLAQIRKTLDQGDALSADYRYEILKVLLARRHSPETVHPEDYIGDAIRLAARDPKYEPVLKRCRDANETRFAAEWKKLFERRDWKCREGLVKVAADFPDSKLELIGLCLADSSAEIRKLAVANIGFRDLQYDRIKLVLTFLDDSDIDVRRCAVWRLADELGIQVKVTPCLLLSGISYSISNPYPAASVPGEQNELDSVRAAAQKWLEQKAAVGK